MATINSVPPAIGVHSPGARASKSSAASSCRSNQIMRFGITSHEFAPPVRRFARRRREPNRKCARIQSTAEIAGQAFADFPHGRSWILRQQMRSRHQHAGSADAALCAAAMRETPVASGCNSPSHATPRRSESSHLAPEAPAPNNCSPTRHPCAPSRNRTRLHHSLPSHRSDGGPRAARQAIASSAAHAPYASRR